MADLIFHTQKNALQVDRDGPVEVNFRHLSQWPGGRKHSGIVEGTMQRAKGFNRGAHQRFHRCGIGDAGFNRKRFTSATLDLFCGFSSTCTDIADTDFCALAGKGESSCSPDAAARTRDQNDLPGIVQQLSGHEILSLVAQPIR